MYLYEEERLVEAWNGNRIDPPLVEFLMQDLPKDAPRACWRISPEFLMTGAVLLPDGRSCVLLGPACSFVPDLSQCRKLLQDMGESTAHLKVLQQWFMGYPTCTSQRFQTVVAQLAALLWDGEVVECVQLHDLNPATAKPLRIDIDYIDSVDPEFDRQLEEVVSSGSLEKAHQFLDSMVRDSSHVPAIGADARQTMQMLAMVLMTLISRIAMRAGLAYEVSQGLWGMYWRQIMMIRDYDEFLSQFSAMLLDYTRRVADCRLPGSESTLVLRVDRYIRTHMNEAVKAGEVAEALHLNLAYLGREFKKHAGLTLTEYIRQVKLREAQRLLETTDLDPAEISVRLGFASQQYFNTLFRTHAGCSPMKYRQARRQEKHV